jgi:hypothetical protein
LKGEETKGLFSKLVVIETTNGISFNPSLYKLVTPLSVLSWLRIVIANRLATGGPSWIDAFKRYNSVSTFVFI